MYEWGFAYVENLTWVYVAANNTVTTLPSAYAQRSHTTLFLFRKEGGATLLSIVLVKACTLVTGADFNTVHPAVSRQSLLKPLQYGALLPLSATCSDMR